MKTIRLAQLTLCGLILFNTFLSASPIKSLDEILTGSMVMQNEKGAEKLPLIDTQVNISINGMVAHVEVKQFFENPSDEVIEATYYFPLPETAAVEGMEMTIGNRRIVGKIKEKQEAQRIYQEAREAGKKVALLEQSKANLFRNKVANIRPQEVIEIKLSYYQTVTYEQGEFSLRFPSTITPRYTPEVDSNLVESFAATDSGWTEDATSSTQIPIPVDSHSRSDHQLSIDVSLNTGIDILSIESSSHEINSLRLAANQFDIQLTNSYIADRDFELTWKPTEDSQPRLIQFNEAVSEEPGYLYSQLILLPPSTKKSNPLPREVTFIIDHSGSMLGDSMVQAKIALARAIENLTNNDRFNVIGFNQKATSLFDATVEVSDYTKQIALEYVNKMEAEGGTEMSYALAAALDEMSLPGYVRQVVFLTDGAVNNEDELLGLIHHGLGNGRLFTIGIGSAPNSYFMRKAAEFGQGSYTYINNTADVAAKMDKLLQQLQYPVMQNISLDFSEPVEFYPLKVPDLYLGQPLSLIIRRPATAIDLNVVGKIDKTQWQADVSFNDDIGSEAKGIARIWAGQKVQQLLDEQITSGQPDANRDEIIQVAIQHQLLSPYTSFIAVEELISRAKDEELESKNIPNIAPNGSQSFGYPTTALNWQWQLFLGSLLLLLGSIIKFRRVKI